VVFPIFCILSGIAIGLSCNVIALLAITAMAALATALGALCNDLPMVPTIGTTVIAWACLQGGYIMGLTARDIWSQIVARFNGMQSRRI
jgi:hypothetical protein